MFGFEKLDVWQFSIEYADRVYAVTRVFPDDERFGLTSQLRRAAVSVAANIAEGSGSLHQNEFRQYLNIARRSTFECASMLHVFQKLEVLTDSETTLLLDRSDELSRKIVNYIKTLKGAT